jgi:hypothetical protein
LQVDTTVADPVATAAALEAANAAVAAAQATATETLAAAANKATPLSPEAQKQFDSLVGDKLE